MKHHLLLASAALLAFGGTAIAQQTGTDTMGAPTSSSVDPTSSKNPSMMSDGMATGSTAAPMTSTDATAQMPTDAATAQATTPSADPAMPATGMAQQGMTTDTQSASTSGMAGTGASADMQTASNVNVQADWSKYDPDNSGSLTPLEFGKWVMAANGQDMSGQVDRTRTSRSANLPAVKVLNATAAAFSKADTNKDRAISPDELSTFLAG